MSNMKEKVVTIYDGSDSRRIIIERPDRISGIVISHNILLDGVRLTQTTLKNNMKVTLLVDSNEHKIELVARGIGISHKIADMEKVFPRGSEDCKAEVVVDLSGWFLKNNTPVPFKNTVELNKKYYPPHSKTEEAVPIKEDIPEPKKTDNKAERKIEIIESEPQIKQEPIIREISKYDMYSYDWISGGDIKWLKLGKDIDLQDFLEKYGKEIPQTYSDGVIVLECGPGGDKTKYTELNDSDKKKVRKRCEELGLGLAIELSSSDYELFDYKKELYECVYYYAEVVSHTVIQVITETYYGSADDAATNANITENIISWPEEKKLEL